MVAELESTVHTRLAAVHARITQAARAVGRDPDTITLVAVSKLQPVEAMRAAYAAGQRDFGENYVDELLDKRAALADLPDLRIHLIGHLQRNKVRKVVPAVSGVETVDTERLARALADQASSVGRILDVHLQVNVCGEASKSGCAPDALDALVACVRGLPSLHLVGLMTVPANEGAEASRPAFAALRTLAARHGVRGLSMGMSGDLEAAIAEGSTRVRVGSAIFGERPPRPG
jgi:pyridoxal phosphate enzyme (YggS family)